PLRPSIPMVPAELPNANAINEPGHRLLALQQHDSAHVDFSASFPSGLPVSTRWETAVANTRPPTNSDFGNTKRPRGIGCIYARTPLNASGKSQYGMRICRGTADGHFNVSKPAGEDVIVTVDVTQNWSTVESTFYSNNNDPDGVGELLRLEISTKSPTN